MAATLFTPADPMCNPDETNARMAATMCDMHETVLATRELIERSREAMREVDRLLERP